MVLVILWKPQCGALIILQFNPKRPPFSWVFSKPERILSFGFGSGLIYPAPGTWGSFTGWLLWFLFFEQLGAIPTAILLVTSFVLGCYTAQQCCDDLGVADHSGINWDEIVAVWLVLWLIPNGFWFQLAGVLLFRFFDILKPPPINIFDNRYKNGFGVMIDDIIAAFYTILVIQIILFLF